MAAYDLMYLKLFNAITDVINILQAAQIETEVMYMEQEPANIILLKLDNADGSDKE